MICKDIENRLHSLRVIRESEAFTLIELLCVLAIIGIIVGIAVSAPNLWRSTNVTTAGNMVMEDMAYARELAIANNEPTEVWFLRPTGTTAFISSQIYVVDQSGNATSYGTVHHLPANLMIDSGSFLSPLFTSGNQKSFTGSQAQPWIASYQTGYQAWFVRFMPDGSTTLSTTQQWYLTLHDVSLGDQLTALPKNYAMVSLDPVTGAVSLYRP